MSKLNTKIKYVCIYGYILWSEFDLIIKKSITYSIFNKLNKFYIGESN